MIRMGNPNFLFPAAHNGLHPAYVTNSNIDSTYLRGTVTTYKSLKCWYTNTVTLSNKFNELKSRRFTDKPDIVAVTEVNCKFSASKVDFNIDGYKTIQSITTNSHQRGVCIFVNSALCAFQDDTLSYSLFSESIWCWIPLANKDCLLFGVIYCSPNSDISNFNNLCSLLTQAVILVYLICLLLEILICLILIGVPVV